MIGDSENGKMDFVTVEHTVPDTPDSHKFISNAFDKATLCIKDWINLLYYSLWIILIYSTSL